MKEFFDWLFSLTGHKAGFILLLICGTVWPGVMAIGLYHENANSSFSTPKLLLISVAYTLPMIAINSTFYTWFIRRQKSTEGNKDDSQIDEWYTVTVPSGCVWTLLIYAAGLTAGFFLCFPFEYFVGTILICELALFWGFYLSHLIRKTQLQPFIKGFVIAAIPLTIFAIIVTNAAFKNPLRGSKESVRKLILNDKTKLGTDIQEVKIIAEESGWLIAAKEPAKDTPSSLTLHGDLGCYMGWSSNYCLPAFKCVRVIWKFNGSNQLADVVVVKAERRRATWR